MLRLRVRATHDSPHLQGEQARGSVKAQAIRKAATRRSCSSKTFGHHIAASKQLAMVWSLLKEAVVAGQATNRATQEDLY